MITTKRLTIRPIEENDWTAIKEIWDMLALLHESDKSEVVGVAAKLIFNISHVMSYGKS